MALSFVSLRVGTGRIGAAAALVSGLAISCLAISGLAISGHAAGPLAPAFLHLAAHGQTSWKIVVPKNSSPAETYASQELRTYLKQITGADFPLVTDTGPLTPNEIIVGDASNAHLAPALKRSHAAPLALASLGDEGFEIRTLSPHYLVIAGGRQRGAMYGIYTFLADYAGCRWWSSSADTIPRRPTLTLPKISQRQKPYFEDRDQYYFDAQNAAYCVHNGLNGPHSFLTPQMGGTFPQAAPMHHTFGWLLPADTYFKTHPEYFMLDEHGVRIPAQPCLSNPEVVKVVTERVLQWMKDNPEDRVFSVSQNDGPTYCHDPACTALNAAAGSPQGSLLSFVNKVAAGVKQQYPNNIIETFAYDYSSEPPKNGLRPASNVAVQFCMWYDYNTNAGLLKHWAKLTSDIYIFDYNVSFTHFLCPFPNFDSTRKQYALYKRYHVHGIMAEGQYWGPGSEFMELRQWLLAKLMWNPDYDMSAGMNEFLNGYYGSAGPYLRRYIDLLTKNRDTTSPDPVWKDRFKGWWLAGTGENMFYPAAMQSYDRLFAQAENAVQNDPVRLQRVQTASLGPMTVELEMMDKNDPARSALAARYFKLARQAGVRHYGEFVTLDDYEKKVDAK